MNTSKAMNTFNGALKEIREATTETTNAIAGEVADTALQASAAADKAVKRNPWAFMGAAAVFAGAIGFFAGRHSRF